MRISKFLLLTVFLSLSACGPSFEPQAYVSGLRVLAATASPPEIAAGEETTITVLAVEPSGEAITLDWASCLAPAAAGSRTTTADECFEEESSPYLMPIGSGSTVTYRMPTDLSLEVLGIPDSTFGFYVPLRIRARTATQSVDAVYRLRLALPPPYTTEENHNPTIDRIVRGLPVDGGIPDEGQRIEDATPPVVRVGEDLIVGAFFQEGDAEAYTTIEGDPREMMFRPVTETLRVSWYTTYGKFSEERTGQERPFTTWTAKEFLPENVDPDGTPVDVWVAARDERGGQSFVHRTILLIP